jgi:hypothetical protein
MKSGMKSIGSSMYATAPATSSLSVVDTRMSVTNPPRSRRKFGSSFIVPITVRLAPVRGADAVADSVSRDVPADRAAPAVRVRRFRADDVALERAD